VTVKGKVAHPTHLLTFPVGRAAYIDVKGAVHSFRVSDSGEPGRLHSYTGSRFIDLEDVQLASDGYFVGRREKDAASVLRIDEDGVVTQAWDFSDAVRLRAVISRRS
jgi:hypothetical protein